MLESMVTHEYRECELLNTSTLASYIQLSGTNASALPYSENCATNLSQK